MVCRSSRATSKRPFFMADHGLVEELLVGLLGVHVGQRVGAQILIFLVLGLLGFVRGLGHNRCQNQYRQRSCRNLPGKPVHTTSMWAFNLWD